jgi:hypothetical protein
MDVNQLPTVNEDDGVFEHFKDAKGDLMYDIAADGKTKTPVGAVVSGTFSSHYRKAERKMQAVVVMTGQQVANETTSPEEIVERSEAEALALQVACIRSWTFTASGQPFEITVDNWRALLAKQPQWQHQVHRRMHNHAGFFPAA